MDIKIDKVVTAYIKLRDQKAQLKKAFDASTEALDQQMDELENFILAKSQELGVDSFKTEAGTAYRHEVASATIADWDATLPFIRDNELWNMLERRVSKKAVEEYKAAHGEIPPGISYNSMFKVGVRRS